MWLWDVLEALKIKINLEPNDIEKEIYNNNFGFMFAPIIIVQ